MTYIFRQSVSLPGGVTAVSFGSQTILSVGSADGCLRLYNLPGTRVIKAIRQLGDEVSSIRWSVLCEEDKGEVWIASGINAFKFSLNAQQVLKPISSQDAISKLELGEDSEDILNDLCLSDNNKFLAFCSDSGTVGVIDLGTSSVSRMRHKHESICSAAKFVPNRPSEIVSGGYDSALLHFDFPQKKLLSRLDIASAPPTSGISMSPPFVLSIALSPSGLIAAAIADGRVWIGSGGDRSSIPSKGKGAKRSRKWEGLDDSSGTWVQVAEGPIVAIAFSGDGALIACSLLGTLRAYSLTHDADMKLRAEKIWSGEVKEIAKVNALSLNDTWMVVGGLTKEGKGLFEIWDHSSRSEDGEQSSSTTEPNDNA
ncbi:hypothetical protein NLI96_g201 [Meripilus lineatus]|uniref:WD40 repeat-like protein n=1 Tax=Meripilus lineatus TaxID=2056292 RepID=A0AAD5VET6_9APHY|nr:hypothetical protein NLI96_g201 [Physisporinus lineatus]